MVWGVLGWFGVFQRTRFNGKKSKINRPPDFVKLYVAFAFSCEVLHLHHQTYRSVSGVREPSLFLNFFVDFPTSYFPNRK